MLSRSWPNLTLKLLRHTQETPDHLRIRLHEPAVRTLLLANVEAPQDSDYVDEEGAFGDVNAGADTSACAVGEVVSV